MIATRKIGWIGADIGNSTLKVVQLERVENRLRLAATAIIPRRSYWTADGLQEDQTLSSADELRAVVSLRAGFRGRRLAAALPMSLCDLHVLDQPLDEQRGNEGAVVQAIETVTQRSAEHLQYASWAAEPALKEGQTSRTNVIVVASSWTDQLCADVAQTGWSCQVVDALPFCLARAVAMVQRDTPEVPVAALDWGFRRATFCVIVDSRPVYVRCLKECSLERLLVTLTDNLNVTPEEAQRLLLEHGIAGNAAGAAGDAAEVIGELTSEPLRQLEEEIARTISHLKGQRRSIVPKQIQLFGGGATMKGLATHLTTQLPADVCVWRFDGQRSQEVEPGGVPSCLFGPAVALSALAWENQ